jgi:hypothetical protein
MRIPNSTRLSSIIAILLVSLMMAGCAEQPYGYIFQPESRDMVNVAYQASDFISALYDQADLTAKMLEEAGLTTDYRSILPDGWVDITPRDGSGRIVGGTYKYARNYLDKQFFHLNIDSAATPGAIRQPAYLDYGFSSIASIQNIVTNQFYPVVDEVQSLQIGYSRNFQDINNIDGWFSIRKVEPFEQELEVSVGGRAQTYNYDTYLPVTWSLKVDNFSISKTDQRGHIIIEGQFPILDQENIIQSCHVSGEFTINADGTGGGDIWLYGQPAARLKFTGRSFSFNGSFTLFSENHEKIYSGL